MSNAMRYWTMIAVLLAGDCGHGVPLARRIDAAGASDERFSQRHRELSRRWRRFRLTRTR